MFHILLTVSVISNGVISNTYNVNCNIDIWIYTTHISALPYFHFCMMLDGLDFAMIG